MAWGPGLAHQGEIMLQLVCSITSGVRQLVGPTFTTTIISTVQGEEAAIAMRGPGKRWCASHIKGLPKRNCNESDILPQVSQAS